MVISINTSLSNGLMCKIDNSNYNLFFSLVDYRNNLFTSNDPKKIIEFFNGFENRNQLIQWMKERPKGTSNIHEVEGDKNIIVVIPTADFEGKYARECRENIFRGLHIIFVESGRGGDFYFNYSHNCNVGIQKAMEYNPKWIVISNDDMLSDMKPNILAEELTRINYHETDMVLSRGSNQTNTEIFLSALNFVGKFFFKIIRVIPLYRLLGSGNKTFFSGKVETWTLNNKFCNKYILNSRRSVILKMLVKRIYYYHNFEAFGIFSSKFIRESGMLFDETFINGSEDHYLSISASLRKRITEINYSISGMEGMSLGIGEMRDLKEVANNSYLNYLIEKYLCALNNLGCVNE